MSELGTLHAVDDVILTAAQWNAGFRRLSRELLNFLRYWTFGDTAPATGGGGVVGGLAVTSVADALQSSVAPGLAFFYDTGLADPLSPFSLLTVFEALVGTHTAADGTNPRLDLICIRSPTGTDTAESVMMFDAAPESHPTQRGAQPVVLIVAGTPDASPEVPATPTGYLALGYVEVLASATHLNSAVRADARAFSRGPRNRGPEANPEIRWHQSEGTNNQLWFSGTRRGDDRSVSVGISYDDTWPRVLRASVATGDEPGAFFPMMISGSREWMRRASPLTGRHISTDEGEITAVFTPGTGTAVPQASIAKAGTGTGSCSLVVPVPVEERGLDCMGGEVSYSISQAFDPGVITASLYHVPVGGSAQLVGTVTITNEIAAGTAALVTITRRPVTGTLFWRLTVADASGGSAAGVIAFTSVGAKLCEGRAAS